MIHLKIKDIAQEKGVSQRRLSLDSKVDINTVRKVFKNPYSIVNTETLEKFAKILGVDASALIESHDDTDALIWIKNFKMEEAEKKAKRDKLAKMAEDDEED